MTLSLDDAVWVFIAGRRARTEDDAEHTGHQTATLQNRRRTRMPSRPAPFACLLFANSPEPRRRRFIRMHRIASSLLAISSLVLAIGLGSARATPLACPASKCGQVQAITALRAKVSASHGMTGVAWDAAIRCTGATLRWSCSWTGNGAGSATVTFAPAKPWRPRVVLASGATT